MRKSTPRAAGKTSKDGARAGQGQTRKKAGSTNDSKRRPMRRQDLESKRLKELRQDVDDLAGRVDSMLEGEDWIQTKLYDLSLSLAALVAGAAQKRLLIRSPRRGPPNPSTPPTSNAYAGFARRCAGPCHAMPR